MISLVGALLASHLSAAGPAYKPEGEMRWALYVTLSPSWFDPVDVAVAGLMLINPYPWSAPLEDVRLKKL